MKAKKCLASFLALVCVMTSVFTVASCDVGLGGFTGGNSSRPNASTPLKPNPTPDDDFQDILTSAISQPELQTSSQAGMQTSSQAGSSDDVTSQPDEDIDWKETEGLEYVRIDGRNEYAWYKMGDVTSTTIMLPSTYNGFPVTSISYSTIVQAPTNIKNLRLPDTLTSVGNLSTITQSCKDLRYNEYDNAYYLGSESNPYLVLVKAKNLDITSCKIHEETRFIGSSAFYKCANLKEIVIPDKVIEIAGASFGDCKQLESVSIGKSVTTIVGSPFSGARIKKFSIPDSIKQIAFIEGVLQEVYTEYKGGRYLGNENNPYVYLSSFSRDETSAEIHPNTRVIGEKAFYKTELESIVIPDKVVSIGEHAFDGSKIKSVVIGDSVEYIEDYAFWLCKSLEKVAMGKSIKDIGTCAFQNCTKAKITGAFPATLRKIENHAFGGCNQLDDVTFQEGLLYIGSEAFVGTKLKSIMLPDTLYYLGSNAFSKMGSYNIPVKLSSGLTTIESGTFNTCSISEIVIPDSITSIGDYAFYNSGLESIVIPDNVTSIGAHAFYWCRFEYGEVVLPASLTSIGTAAFENCGHFSITFKGTMEQWNAIAKSEGWDKDSTVKQVICSDGTLSVK